MNHRRSIISVASLALFALLVPAAILFADEPAPGKQVAQSVEVKRTTDQGEVAASVRFWLYLPEGYSAEKAKTEKWPLILFLHGSGERGDNLDLVKVHGPPKILAADAKEPQKLPFIVVSPQCDGGARWNAAELVQVVDQLAAKYSADPQRLYLTGLSMGGYGTWNILADFPGKFAAAVPVCGGGKPESAEKMIGTPIWVFHGAKDNAVPLSRSEEMVEALKKAGGNVQFTIYPEAGHDSWTETYNNPKLYQWLLEQKLPAAK